jgi:SWIM zinc finger
MEIRICPKRSEGGAIRLFTAGYLRKVQPVAGSPETWVIPSETMDGTSYTLSLDPKTNEMTCNCPGFRYRNYCKHSRFLAYAFGLVVA